MQNFRHDFKRAGLEIEVPDAIARHRRQIRNGLLVLAAYSLILLVSMVTSSPFSAGLDAIAEHGGWDREDLAMRHGSYGFRFLYAVAEVSAWVDTENGRVPARVEMVRATPFSWTVQAFQVRAPR
jgi:hypothetical protein